LGKREGGRVRDHPGFIRGGNPSARLKLSQFPDGPGLGLFSGSPKCESMASMISRAWRFPKIFTIRTFFAEFRLTEVGIDPSHKSNREPLKDALQTLCIKGELNKDGDERRGGHCDFGTLSAFSSKTKGWRGRSDIPTPARGDP
jgi:hypothetical protein